MLYDVKSTEDYWNPRNVLVLGDNELHWDGGEPEDNSFDRRYAWVPHLLNVERGRWIELQDELEKYLAKNDLKISDELREEMTHLFVHRFDKDAE